MLFRRNEQGIKDADISIKRKLIEKIIDNDFEVNRNHTVMFVDIEEGVFALSDADVEELVYSGIEKRVELKRGIAVEEFYKNTGTYKGYRIFDKSLRPEFQEGSIVEDKGTHGLYFVIEYEDMFRILMASYFENFGDYLAVISLVSLDEKRTPVSHASISRGMDTNSTDHARAFYIEKIQTLDDYELIVNMYEAAPDNYKLLIYDDSEHGMYKESIKYYSDRGCNEIVRALQDIHQIEKKRHHI